MIGEDSDDEDAYNGWIIMEIEMSLMGKPGPIGKSYGIFSL